MNYCINPECKQRQNFDDLEYCQSCGTSLLINARYRLIKPLRQLDLRNPTEIFEVDDRGSQKVMKVLKDNSTKLVDLLEQEASVLQWLNHPGIPKVEIDGYFSFLPSNSTQNLHCLVMEKIDGENLEEWLEKHGSISQGVALNWLKQIIEILDFIHGRGFFHRDIKPSNIMLKPNGKITLIDFGSVREITDTYLVKISGGSGEGIGSDITGIISTGYTPMEQVNGRAVPQSDFYALGRTFVRLLTGKSLTDLPINPETGRIIWRKQAPQVSNPLADFIDDLMAPFPGERPQNAQVILRRLTASSMFIQRILRLFGSPRVRRRTTALLFWGIIGLGIYQLSRPWQAEYFSSQGRKALMAENLDSARKNLERAIALNPNDAISRSDLGLVCKQQKEFECALNEYKQALKLESDNVNRATIHYNVGGLFEYIRDFDTALKHYKVAMQDNGELGANATNNFARLQIWQKNNNSLAINLILKALYRTENLKLKLTSDKYLKLKSTLYKNLGWAHLQEGDYRSAENYLREAILLDKGNRAAAHCLLAKVLQPSDKADVLTSWKNCRNFGSEDLPEVETWQLDAHRYLKAEGSKR